VPEECRHFYGRARSRTQRKVTTVIVSRARGTGSTSTVLRTAWIVAVTRLFFRQLCEQVDERQQLGTLHRMAEVSHVSKALLRASTTNATQLCLRRDAKRGVQQNDLLECSSDGVLG
jgi:hypothetical protein